MEIDNTSMESSPVIIKDTDIILTPDNQRVIVRPHIPSGELRVERIISRIMALDEADMKKEIDNVLGRFSHRHHDFEALLEDQFNSIRRYMPSDILPTWERRLLIGSYFLSEYSFESAALFNPSIVLHYDQSGLPYGSLRFIIALRATGEGHISSLTFRSGCIDANNNISVDKLSGFASTAEMKPNTLYEKETFARKIYEMHIDNDFSNYAISSLPEQFTIDELQEKLKSQIFNYHPVSQNDKITSDKILWLAQCNYEADFNPDTLLSERILFPLSPSEQNGIEDVRFVLFTDDDKRKKFYGTYTAYDGRGVLPQLMETEDFVNFKMITLNGRAALNKGMALFPRKINGRYAMVSRQDNENLFLMFSDNIHFWFETIPLMKPSYSWEFMQIGTCGSPIETEHGWLLLTHGVGPFRQYSIGAILLDKENPSKIIGRLKEPLIQSTETSRSGYVPNVVYTCGAMLHNDTLVVPYAMSDQRSTIGLISLPSLLEKLMHS